MDSLTLPLRQDPFFDDVWYCSYWPRSVGWASITSGREVVNKIFIHPEESFRALDVANKIRNNQLSLRENVDAINHNLISRKELPSYIFFIIFVMSISFLWLEPKL